MFPSERSLISCVWPAHPPPPPGAPHLQRPPPGTSHLLPHQRLSVLRGPPRNGLILILHIEASVVLIGMVRLSVRSAYSIHYDLDEFERPMRPRLIVISFVFADIPRLYSLTQWLVTLFCRSAYCTYCATVHPSVLCSVLLFITMPMSPSALSLQA